MIITAFPVPGHNFRDVDGNVRGVHSVTADFDGEICIQYVEGEPDYYEPEFVS